MKKKILACSLFAFTCLIGCQNNNKKEVEIEEQDPVVEHSYKEVSEYKITWEEIFEVQKKNYYVYFYSDTCSHCIELKNYIIEKALQIKKIYFIAESNQNQLSNSIQESINAEKPENIWILGYPTLLKIENKKCSQNIAGNKQIQNELK